MRWQEPAVLPSDRSPSALPFALSYETSLPQHDLEAVPAFRVCGYRSLLERWKQMKNIVLQRYDNVILMVFVLKHICK